MAADRHGLHLSRRRFVQGAGVAGLGLLAGYGRLLGQASAGTKIARVGFVSPESVSSASPNSNDEAFRAGLHGCT
jgi:hypothetical protein